MSTTHTLTFREETYFFQAKCSDNKCSKSGHGGDEAWQEVRSVNQIRNASKGVGPCRCRVSKDSTDDWSVAEK